MDEDTLEKRLQREKQKVALLENMIEEKTRDSYIAKEKFREQSEFLNKVINALPHPFFVVDVKDYAILMANSITQAGNLSDRVTCYELMHQSTTPCNSKSDYLCPLAEVRRTKKPVMVEHI